VNKNKIVFTNNEISKNFIIINKLTNSLAKKRKKKERVSMFDTTRKYDANTT